MTVYVQVFIQNTQTTLVELAHFFLIVFHLSELENLEITIVAPDKGRPIKFLTNVTGEFAFKLMPKLKTKIIFYPTPSEQLSRMSKKKKSKLD